MTITENATSVMVMGADQGPISLALESGSPASTFLQTPADKLRSEHLSTFTLTAV